MTFLGLILAALIIIHPLYQIAKAIRETKK